MGHFPGVTLFLALLGLCDFAMISTLNFGPSSTKLGGNVWASKKWPRMTTDLVWAEITAKRPFLRFAEKCFFGQKCVLSQKNTQNLLRDWYLFWKMVLFSLHNFFQSWPGPGVQQEVNLFFGPKSRFLPYDPNFGQWPVRSPRRDSLYPTLWTIFDFSFPSYGRFRKKSLPPPHCTVGAPSASNRPSALSAQARACALRTRAW